MDAPQQLAGAAMAQAQATLALAYEQRTANLIALYKEEGLDVNYGYLFNQIKERLGLA